MRRLVQAFGTPDMGTSSRRQSFEMLAFAAGLMVAVFVLMALASLAASWGMPIDAEQAVEIASRRLREIDPAFRPSDHVARAFRECGIAPLTIDYSRRDGGPVVAHVIVEPSGTVRRAEFFGREQGVESYRTGLLFLFKPDGMVASEMLRPLPQTASIASDEL